MTDPPDDTPPPEEIEMAVEEYIGKPLAGKPADRIEAMKRRIDYLERMIANVTAGGLNDQAVHDTLSAYQRDLREAQQQLTEWQAQHEGRN